MFGTHPIIWRCRDRKIVTGRKSIIMGVLNVTPDSFSDGGRYINFRAAIKRARVMVEEGADIIDIGGESSRPGARPVSVEEEARRVLPVVKALAEATRCVISVDTTKASIADLALLSGAHIINDISAMTFDPKMPGVARHYGAGVILMHMKGEPRTMQRRPRYGNVVREVVGYLKARIGDLAAKGIAVETLAVDPGIGFGKTLGHNLKLLAGLPRLAECGRPVAVGLSRKSFLGKITGLDVEDRLAPSLAALSFATMRGASIYRVHDVKESCAVARVMDMLRQERDTK